MTLFCLSLSKIQESECVASSSEQNCAIFVMMVVRESACAACLAILAGNKAGEIKPISMTYHIKIDVNPFCFSDLHLLYGQDLCLSKHQGLVYCCVNWDRPR